MKTAGTVLFALLALQAPCHATDLAGSRPNIIFILSDDQGHGDLSCHGNPVLQTPNVDRLHAEGARFTDFHVSPTCAPTRSALLTGRHEFKNGVTHTILERERLTLKAITLAEVLHDAGYATGIFGKWHLGDESQYQPGRRGFDEVFIHGAGGIGQTYAGSCGDAPDNTYFNPVILHQGRFEKTTGYCTDVFFAQATNWIAHVKGRRPFFAWIAPNAPHAPLQVRAEDEARYAGKVQGTNTAKFFGMIANLDDNVGRLLAALKAWDLERDTLVIFMNDNGGTVGTGLFNSGMRGQKASAWLGGTRAASFWRWPGRIAPADLPPLAAHVDVFPTLAELAGAKLSRRAQAQVEGRSLVPLLENPGAPWADRTLFTHVGRWPKGTSPDDWKFKACSVRSSRWHLVSPDGATTPNWQLYDVSADLAETNNVAAARPDVVRKLATAYDSWWASLPPFLVNEKAIGPRMNPFKELYWKQFGGGPSPKPNILFCFADDWGRYAGAYAKVDAHPSPNDVIRTPNVDRVAREGVLFRNAFVPAPSCTPCRSALLTGRYWWNTGRGAILQGAVWDAAIPSFPLLLRDAGWHIGKSFKVWSPGTPADAPFGRQQHAYEQAGRDANNFSENVTRWVADGMNVAAARAKIHAEVRGNFEAFLADRKPGQPWLYWFGPTTTHRTWIKGSGKKLWGIDPDSLRGRMPKFLPDVPEVREDLADYLGEAQAYDSYVGVLLQRLEETGELDHTLVIVSGDHGMPGVPGGKCNLYDFGTSVALVARVPGGRPGRVVDDFVNLMDLAPTLLEVAGVKSPAGVNGRSFLDVLKSDKSGQVDPARTWVVTGRERHVGGARDGNLPYPMRALRTRDFLYIRNFAPDRWPMGAPFEVTATGAPSAAQLEHDTRIAFPDMDASPTKAWLVEHRDDETGRRYFDHAFARRPAEELYDLRNDAGQTNNVAASASLAVEKQKLSARLMKVLRENTDPRVTGDGGTFDRPPFTDPEPPAGGGAVRKGPKSGN